MAEEKELMWISGFWRRIGAFLIDSIILGLVGLGLGLVLEELFVEIGVWGRFIGFLIALIYFGVMNSSIANGQTLGKKALKLRVVNSGNLSISVIRSFGRYSIIGIPFFLNGAQFSIDTISSFWLYVLSLVIFGGLFSIAYLYLFNRVTRQSLHDLAFGTYVVNIGIDSQNVGKIWNPHLIVVGLLFLTAAIVPIFTSDLARQEPFAELLKSIENLQANPSVNHATVSFGKSSVSTVKTGTSETSFVSAQVFLQENQTSNAELARELAESLMKSYRQALEKDLIVIVLVYGYDIGIASKWNSHSHRFNPSELSSNE